MKTPITTLALAMLLLLAAGAAAASVNVTFVHPETFADMPFLAADRADVLKQLQSHFERIGKALPAGQDLKLEILDVDLAGRIRTNFRGQHDVRVLNGRSDWPQIHLRYTLESDGKVLQSGEEELRDMTYLDHMTPYTRDQSLRYEKQMIDQWFKDKFGVKLLGYANVPAPAMQR